MYSLSRHSNEQVFNSTTLNTTSQSCSCFVLIFLPYVSFTFSYAFVMISVLCQPMSCYWCFPITGVCLHPLISLYPLVSLLHCKLLTMLLCVSELSIAVFPCFVFLIKTSWFWPVLVFLLMIMGYLQIMLYDYSPLSGRMMMINGITPNKIHTDFTHSCPVCNTHTNTVRCLSYWKTPKLTQVGKQDISFNPGLVRMLKQGKHQTMLDSWSAIWWTGDLCFKLVHKKK